MAKIQGVLTAPNETVGPISGSDYDVNVHINPSLTDESFEIVIESSVFDKDPYEWITAATIRNNDDRVYVAYLSKEFAYRFRLISLSGGSVEVTLG